MEQNWIFYENPVLLHLKKKLVVRADRELKMNNTNFLDCVIFNLRSNYFRITEENFMHIVAAPT